MKSRAAAPAKTPPAVAAPAPRQTSALEHLVGSLPTVLLAQTALLTLVGWKYRYALNSDAIAYLRIASYYADGKFALAISGYWGPLLSWLMVPLIRLGVDPVGAARVVMGLSALLFTAGCREVFRAFELPESARRFGVWLAAGLSLYWSVENITPDLLAGGSVALACSRMLTPGWLERRRDAIFAGLFWGIAFWAKAVAFFLAIGVVAGVAGLWILVHRRSAAREVLRSLGLTLLVFGVLAGAWIGVISRKYQQLTISTSARLNHAMVGPPDRERPYPFGWNFQAPEPGRVTVWEDPSTLTYPDWSPWSSWAYARHQMSVIAGNLSTVSLLLTGICLAFPALLILAGWRWLQPGWRRDQFTQRWWWSVVPLVVLSALYLPGNLLASEQRYFYPTFPFLYVFAAGIWWSTPNATRSPQQNWLGLGLLTASFVLPAIARPSLAPGSTRAAGEFGRQLADKLIAAGIRGPIAGSGMVDGGRAGLYAAYYLGEPWLGDERPATVEGYQNSHAKLIIVNRRQNVARDLDQNLTFRSLDQRLFDSPEEASRFPLKVYQAF